MPRNGASRVAFRAPVVGDRVRIGKYAGDSFDGADGRRYILLNDTDVLGHLI
jgi:co-chaperonin GroES (HSP10)